jgi:hypothetical protein
VHDAHGVTPRPKRLTSEESPKTLVLIVQSVQRWSPSLSAQRDWDLGTPRRPAPRLFPPTVALV